MKYNVPWGILEDETTLYGTPYINGDPSIGRAGSIPPASAIEYPQREVVAVIQWAYDHGLVDMENNPCAEPTNGDLQQLLKAIYGMIFSSSRQLTAPATYYVNDATGNDNSDGTTATNTGGHGPFKSVQKALNVAGTFFPGQFGITVEVAPGTYSYFQSVVWAHPAVTINGSGMSGGSRTYFTSTSPGGTCSLQGPNSFWLGNCAVANTSGLLNNNAVGCGGGAKLTINNIQFEGATNGSHMNAGTDGQLSVGAVSINGPCNIVMSAEGGFISIPSAVITMLTEVYCVGAFAYAGSNGNIGCYNGPLVGQFVNRGYVRGKRYVCDSNGTIQTGGQGGNYFPGDLPGELNTGGQYT